MEVARTCEFLARVAAPKRLREVEGGTGDTITSLVWVSFYDLPLARPVFPSLRAARGVRRPATVNDQKIRAIVPTLDARRGTKKSPSPACDGLRSIGVNGYSTTCRPTFSTGRRDAFHHSYDSMRVINQNAATSYFPLPFCEALKC